MTIIQDDEVQTKKPTITTVTGRDGAIPPILEPTYNTDYKAETAEAMALLSGEAVIPVSDVPALYGYTVTELHSLDDLRKYFKDGAFVYVSKIRGVFYCVPVGE